MIDEMSGDFLQWLRGFYFVAIEGSVRQAAIAMGREKPTISRQIQCLERELGVTLFDRSSRKMIITPEGERLLEEAITLFENVNQIKGEFMNEEIRYSGVIYVVATPAIVNYILPAYIKHFQKLHPEVSYRFEAATQMTIYDKVESTEADFGIASFDGGHKTLQFYNLYEAGMVMIVSKNQSFFSGKAIPTLKQIAETPLILISHQGSPKPIIRERFARERLKPNIVMIHNNHIGVKHYVSQGIGAAIVAEHSLSREDEQIFNIYSLDKYFHRRNYGILLKKKKYLPNRVKAFIQLLKPDIDFSANAKIAEKKAVLSLNNFLQNCVCLSEMDEKHIKPSKIRKRASNRYLRLA